MLFGRWSWRLKGGDMDVKIFVIIVLLLNMFLIIYQQLTIEELENELQQASNDANKNINKKED